MREVLFRAKGTHGFGCGEWLYGYYVKDFWMPASRGFGILPIDKAYGGYCEVDPETVGQFTGLTDKNGKKIFEGDIVKGLFRFSMPVNSIVSFNDGAFGLLWYREGVETFWAFASICNVEYEVIGNTHDNPELLEVE
jgi:uncharacterized phage protein (TIGR01671 family)